MTMNRKVMRRFLGWSLALGLVGAPLYWLTSIYNAYYDRVDRQDAFKVASDIASAVEPHLHAGTIPAGLADRVEQRGRVKFDALVDVNGIVTVILPPDRFGAGKVVLTPSKRQGEEAKGWSCIYAGVSQIEVPAGCQVLGSLSPSIGEGLSVR